MAAAQSPLPRSVEETNAFGPKPFSDMLPGMFFSRCPAPGWAMKSLQGGCLPVTGYDQGALDGGTSPFYDSLRNAGDLPAISEALRSATEMKGPYVVEYRIATKSGVEKWVCEKGAPELGTDGLVEGFTGFICDITGYKMKEEASRRDAAATAAAFAAERNILRTLLDNLPDFVFVKDLECRYILSNVAHTRSLGFSSPLEIEGRTVFNFFAKDVAEHFTADDMRVIESGEPVINREEAHTGVANKKRWVLTTKLPLRDLKGQVAGVIGISRDISEHKHLEEELRQSQKMEAIGRLAGGIAHDFNNMLTSIIGFGELLLNNPELDSIARKDAEEIHSAALRASVLTQQLLALGRKQNIQPSMTDLNEVVNRMNGTVRRLVGSNITVTSRLADGLANIHVDAEQIEQVITNVVVNAADAMPEGGTLVLETGSIVIDHAEAQRRTEVAPGAYNWLSIKDSGAGISESIKSRVFEPFFTTKTAGKNAGLGLSTSYGIVKQSGGFMDIDSKQEKGTTVTIYLPGAPVEGTPGVPMQAPSREDAMPHGAETVLLVEDDPSVRKLTSSVLIKLGYSVLEAGDGAKAMEVIRECDTQKIDLLLTDVIMPQIGGKRLADNLEVLSPGTRVLFTSGHNEEEMLLQGLSSREIAFLPKPFSPSLLATKIREVLDR